MSHSHRPTLKQVNKGFKSKHASKGSLKAAAKGKIVSSGTPSSKHKNVTASTKKARLNANAQKREQKRKETVADAKFFSTSSGGGQAPRIISVVPLISNISPRRFILSLLPSLGLPDTELVEIKSTVQANGQGSYLVRAPRFKTNLQINLLPPLAVYPTLDAALVSDYLVLLMSSTREVQLEGEAVLRCLQAQCGGVEVVPVVQAPEDEPTPPAHKAGIAKSLLSFTRYFFPSADKVHSVDSPSDSALLARAICEGAPKTARDDGRAYVLAEGSEAVAFNPTGTDAEGSSIGQLAVTGTVRGGALSADRLVHIPGKGDFQVERIITAPPSTLTLAAKPHHRTANGSSTESSEPSPLSLPTENADDLTAVNETDTMLNEQTWPTEEDMAGAPAAGDGKAEDKPRMKRVPKGTSAYQAAWIVDDYEDDGEDDEDDDEEDDDEDMEEDGAEGNGEMRRFPGEEEEEEMEEIEMDSRRSEVHRDMDPEQEEKEYAAYLKERARAAEEDQVFPDEVDTPRHIPARQRFERYRALKSFRTSPWDPYENLPLDYGRIFQFENWNGTRKRVEVEGREEGVKAGTRVTVILSNVPANVFTDRNPSLPFILHGLLQHEHKQSVLHFVVQRNTEYDAPVKAKDPLVLCVGARRYVVNPVYSQHVRGGGKGVNNVHKSEKFLRAGSAVVATCFGPITFGKSGVVLLKDEGADQVPSLVAMGTPLPPDPTRIIAKRIILTGHPFKIHKKTATIRFMFFNRDDVDYYKSVEMHTKYGRTGHISEPLGTHGYFKAHFDAPIQGMDTICMNLYKRQFPKWSQPFTPPPVHEIVDRTGRLNGAGQAQDGDAEMDME